MLLLAASASAWAEDAETPRQAWDRAQTLFAQGHSFTAEEAADLETLEQRLVDTGDADLASDLRLLRRAATVQAQAAAAQVQAEAQKDEAQTQWEARAQLAQTREFWKVTRDTGLAVFTVATVTSLLLARAIDNDDNLLKNGYFTDYDDRKAVVEKMKWGLAVSVSTAFLSLFPLLWGESRQ
jgi:hypothetical protein